MASRLPLAPDRVAEVATAALVCRQTVQRYRDGVHLLRSTEFLITKAIQELPASPQLDLPVSHDHDVRERSESARPPPTAVEPIREQAGSDPGAKPADGGRRAFVIVPPRARLHLEMPVGCDVPAPDGHWWEERTA